MIQTEQELITVQKIIERRKQEARDKQLFTKLKTIVEELGFTSGWRNIESIYNDLEAGIRITYNYSMYSHREHINVSLRGSKKQVYDSSKKKHNILRFLNKEDVYFYIPGEWEKKVETLFEQYPQIKREEKEKALINEIKELKAEWGI